MSVFFQVFDLSANNVVEEFDTEGEALSLLSAVLEADGADSLSELALLRFEEGHPTLVASRVALVQRVMDALTQRDQSHSQTVPHQLRRETVKSQ